MQPTIQCIPAYADYPVDLGGSIVGLAVNCDRHIPCIPILFRYILVYAFYLVNSHWYHLARILVASTVVLVALPVAVYYGRGGEDMRGKRWKFLRLGYGD